MCTTIFHMPTRGRNFEHVTQQVVVPSGFHSPLQRFTCLHPYLPVRKRGRDNPGSVFVSSEPQ